MRHDTRRRLRLRNLSGNPFPSTEAALVFAFALLVFALSEIIGARILPGRKRQGSEVRRRNRGSNTLIIVSWVILFGVSTSLAENNVLLLPDLLSFAGAAVILLGVAVRQWAIAVLGRYFSLVIGVQEGHKVVDSGPYRLVRHPSYTGALLILVGIALSFRSLAAVMAAILIFGVVYGYRMLVEERVLVSELGDSYVKYMMRTKRIIPFIL